MGCRAPQVPSTGTWLGVPAHDDSAWWPRRSGCRPCRRHPVRAPASVRRPVCGASDQCPHLPVHATGVQWPVRASERPRVRWPASGVRRPTRGGRCVPASMVSGRSEVTKRGGGQAAARLGWPGSAWSPAVSTTGSSSAESEPGARSRRRLCWPSGGVGLDLAVVVRGGGSGQVTAWPTRSDAPEDRLSVEARWSEVRLSAADLRGTSHPPDVLLRAQETFLWTGLRARQRYPSRRSRAMR
jgi:hypothetical protein